MTLRETAQRFISYVNRFDLTTAEGRLNGALTASAGAGNPKDSRLAPNDELKKAIQAELDNFMTTVMSKKSLTQSDYDLSFDETVQKIMISAEERDEDCAITYGRIQKIINIWIKYFIMLALAEIDEAQFGKYRNLLPVAHVPVDRKVRNWFWQNLSDASNAAIVKTITSWKWHLTREQYYAIQNDARENFAKFGAQSALELEARVIGEWLA